MSEHGVIALDGMLVPLRDGAVSELRPLDLPGTEMAPGVWLHTDPEAGISGQWSSPRGRLCEIDITVDAPGRWLGLHVALPPFEADAVTWLGIALRVHAARPLALRPCLRSGTDEGFVDTFFDRHALARTAETDHHGVLAPDRHPDLPATAPWRELILFLPSGESLSLALHALRIFAL
ncbi:hypothetical protein JQU17_19895 [Ponticoccus sp. SC2-23]|uniref:hypothetical protein n=1 Tax=Alexandriicola marinus TaxID=2081710 RepID=UPI000FD9ACEB|nr:hypothetical protein [Alexandriicola marinus]MBM1222477.1 hypothetical protein [Ponticoccus sp. SC6-9]MBM1226983.1 hypothetical protein [Ponticoccus sp. SC6-15]MBM1231404.1 hypothetical protein [Ponticoccus sp. SC6-38]MBM1235977.1 hypothetical protein [Ponticoccus sp. SC6-45]MBM1240427.1 hypothetical protein [Ponticoccus sp. SC6-49]MBM1244962.1 hypothetical protein [Ponticoccus sp. SC2-64]MBM1249451.1 hypothetical protein [Ponticoccus sp. SC6-42]MBM1253920.1 hypothetical protein [Pontico